MFPETNDSLIARVRSGTDQIAWAEFEGIYRPVIFRIARARGLPYADSLDIVQQVLMSISHSLISYRKRNESTRFRNWIGRITRNAILKALTRGPIDKAAGGTDAFARITNIVGAKSETERLIELEYQRELYRQAADRVRADIHEHTWLAFEMTVLHGTSSDEVARLLGTNVGSVYAARSRVMRRLRVAVEKIENALEHAPTKGKE